MKIDVEGFEMNVVQGASEFLATHRPTVVMEMNHFCLDVLQRITIPDFLDFMRSVFPYLVAQISTDRETEIKVRVSNAGLETWHAHGEHPVLLCYHWKNSNGDIAVYDGVRTRLVDEEIAPGMSFEQAMTIASPAEKGAYRLVLKLVQEGVCWFEDRGFGCAEMDIEVV